MAGEASTYHLGIDLGTTYTAAAVRRGGRVTVVQLTPDSHAMPSVVALRDDGDPIVGEAAARRALTEPTKVAKEFKRRFGDAAPMVLGGTRTSAEALTLALLREVLQRVQVVEGGLPASVTLTHPAAWGPFRLDKLRDIAAEAGLDDVRLLSEPVAAAAANADRLTDGSLAVVYDLGGGTFDAAVVRVGGDEILGTPEGVERLGGVDIDALILAHVDDATGGLIGDAPISDPEVRAGLARLSDECRAAKEALSTDSETEIAVNLPNLRTTVRLTRSELEALVRPRLADSLAALDRTVASAGVTWDDIATVLLVGGSSRIPLVAQIVREHTARPLTSTTNPNLAVALGAAHSGPEPSEAAAAPDAAPPPPAAPAPAAAAPSSPVTSAAGRSKLPLIIGAVAAVAAIVIGVVVATGGGDDSASPADTTVAVSDGPTDSTAAGGAAPAETEVEPDTSTVEPDTSTVEPETTVAPAPAETELSVGPATVVARPCADPTGILATASSLEIDDGRIAVAAGGNLYLLEYGTDCGVAFPADRPDGVLVDDANEYGNVTMQEGIVVATTGAGGVVIDLATGATTTCDGLRELVAFSATGSLASFDRGVKGYDEYSVAGGQCSLLGANRNPRVEFSAAVARGGTSYLAIVLNGGASVSRVDGNQGVWTAGDDGSVASVDGLSICGPYLCVLDATGGDLVLLGLADGVEVGRASIAELTGGVPLRLEGEGEGWLVVDDAGTPRLFRLDVV